MARAMLPQNFVSEVASIVAVLNDGSRWSDSAANGDQQAATFDAADNSQHPAASILDRANVSVEIFWRAKRIEDFSASKNFRPAHCECPPLLKNKSTAREHQEPEFESRQSKNCNLMQKESGCFVPEQSLSSCSQIAGTSRTCVPCSYGVACDERVTLGTTSQRFFPNRIARSAA